MKFLFIATGTLSLALGIAGIVIPVLPTTPFLLLAAALYMRSSERLYQRLLASRFAGGRVRRFRERGGMSLKEKAAALIMMWCMIFLSLLLTGFNWYVIALGMAGSLVMGFLVKTVSSPGNDE